MYKLPLSPLIAIFLLLSVISTSGESDKVSNSKTGLNPQKSYIWKHKLINDSKSKFNGDDKSKSTASHVFLLNSSKNNNWRYGLEKIHSRSEDGSRGERVSSQSIKYRPSGNRNGSNENKGVSRDQGPDKGYLEIGNVMTGVESVSLLAFSSFMNGTSPECQAAVETFVNEFYKGEDWALRMVDAAGKPHAGVQDGALTWFGSYEECIKIEGGANNLSSPIQGQYCSVRPNIFNATTSSNFTKKIITHLKELNSEVMNLLSMTIGVCVPSACSSLDINNAIFASTGDTLPLTVSCDVKRKSGVTGMIVIICFLGAFACLAIVGTCLDLYCSKSGNPGRARKIFQSFSVYSNGKKILDMDSKSADTLSSLHGIRFFSICWIILGHSYGFTPTSIYDDATEFRAQTFMNPLFDPVIGGELAVDTFFVLSGLLVAYVFLKQMSKDNARLNLPMFYFHRWWRLTPVYMMIIGITTVFVPLMLSGPYASRSLVMLGDCPTNWWTNLLYINNFYNIHGMAGMCLSHSWYLACDMQMYIVSPIILYPLAKWPKLGLGMNTLFLLASMAIPAALVGINNFPPMPTIQADPKTIAFFQNVYIKFYCRMVPYCIGIYIGYLLYHRRRNLQLNKWVSLVGWTCSTAVALIMIYGISIVYKGHAASIGVSVSYVALSKLIWSLIIGWVIVTTTTGNAGIVNTILSCKYLIPLSRLTYCLYLIHPAILYVNTGIKKHTMSFSHVYIVNLFLAVLVIATTTSFMLSILFESPFMNLEKILFHRPSREKKDPIAPIEENYTARENPGLVF